MEIIYNTLSEFFVDLFGVYTPVSYTDLSGINIVPSGAAGVDWPYLCQVALFALVVYSLFRLLGAFISNKF